MLLFDILIKVRVAEAVKWAATETIEQLSQANQQEVAHTRCIIRGHFAFAYGLILK